MFVKFYTCAIKMQQKSYPFDRRLWSLTLTLSENGTTNGNSVSTVKFLTSVVDNGGPSSSTTIIKIIRQTILSIFSCFFSCFRYNN